jgi:small GTP-binding protein
MSELVPGVKEVEPVLSGHTATINEMAWSPDGRLLASASNDGTLRLWNSKAMVGSFDAGIGEVKGLAWSPRGDRLAAAYSSRTVCLWAVDIKDAQSKPVVQHEPVRRLEGHQNWVYCVAWSPDGSTLASAARDGTIKLWDIGRLNNADYPPRDIVHNEPVRWLAWLPDATRSKLAFVAGNTLWLWDPVSGEKGKKKKLVSLLFPIRSLAWSPDGALIATSSDDGVIRLWDSDRGTGRAELAGHEGVVMSVRFSCDGRVLASQGMDGTVRLWGRHEHKQLSVIPKQPCHAVQQIAFHPTDATLLAWGIEAGVEIFHICRARLDIEAFLTGKPPRSTGYRNTKVVIVGDKGTGKSGLFRALLGETHKQTPAIHTHRVGSLFDEEVTVTDGQERHEILLWDLAGQPGCRLIHQLHLSQATMALIVFDTTKQESLEGVKYWNQVLQESHNTHRSPAGPLIKLLVAARVDQGNAIISQEQIKEFVKAYGFSGFFETSAQNNTGINELVGTIRDMIQWEKLLLLPIASHLFKKVKSFLEKERETGRFLISIDNLFRAIKKEMDIQFADMDCSRELLNTCVIYLENAGLFRHLDFGDIVLLKPEFLDIYASAIVDAASNEPAGLGFISKQDALMANFALPPRQLPISEEKQREILLIGTVEELKRYQIAFETDTAQGAVLVFPTELVAAYEGELAKDAVKYNKIFVFDGAVLPIYVTLVVRLACSGIFCKNVLLKNIAEFKVEGGHGLCGIQLQYHDDNNRGELTIYFRENPDTLARTQFCDQVYKHLESKATTLEEKPVVSSVSCPNCGAGISEQIVQGRRERGRYDIQCPVCDRVFFLPGARPSDVTTFENDKRTKGDYDAFLFYDSKNKKVVQNIAKELRAKNLLPWLEDWDVPPGQRWQEVLKAYTKPKKAIILFFGGSESDWWKDLAFEEFLSQSDCPIIPVILGSYKGEFPPILPDYLQKILKDKKPLNYSKKDIIDSLIWGITGDRLVIKSIHQQMFLRKLWLNDVRCIKQLELSFLIGEDSKSRQWTWLLGENGCGKSTVLRSIVLLTLDRKGLRQLMAEKKPDSWIRVGKNECRIKGEFLQPDGKVCELELTIERGDNEDTIVQRNLASIAKIEAALKRSQINYLTIAYGCSRRLSRPKFGPADTQYEMSNPRLANVVTLFDQDSQLQPPEQVAMEIDYRGEPEKVSAFFRSVFGGPLLLPGVQFDYIDKNSIDLYFNTADGKIPLSDLSDGYQTMVSWYMDLIYRVIRASDNMLPEDIPLQTCGLLILDEIDLHLHPVWQRHLRDSIKYYLPNFQIIATTHSPLTAQLAEQDELYILRRSEDQKSSELIEYPNDPSRMMIQQILTGAIFGVPTVHSDQVIKMIEEYNRLALKRSRTIQEDVALENILDDLSDADKADLVTANDQNQVGDSDFFDKIY